MSNNNTIDDNLSQEIPSSAVGLSKLFERASTSDSHENNSEIIVKKEIFNVQFIFVCLQLS